MGQIHRGVTLFQLAPGLSRCLAGTQTLKERQQRALIEVGLNRLPPGMEPVEGCGGRPGTCCACGGDEEAHDDQLLQCDSCRQFVHMGCYGVLQSPDGGPWQCDVCRLGEDLVS